MSRRKLTVLLFMSFLSMLLPAAPALAATLPPMSGGTAASVPPSVRSSVPLGAPTVPLAGLGALAVVRGDNYDVVSEWDGFGGVDLALDDVGCVYVATGGAVLKRDLSGRQLAVIGGSGEGQLVSAQGISFGGPKDHLYVSDRSANRVVEFTKEGTFVRAFATGAMVGPKGITVDPSGNIYVTDDGSEVFKFSPSGGVVWSRQLGPSIGGITAKMTDCAFDAKRNRLMIALEIDQANPVIIVVSANGASYSRWGGSNAFQLYGIAVDDDGNVFVADAWSGNVKRFTLDLAGNIAAVKVLSGYSRPIGVATCGGDVFAMDWNGHGNRVTWFHPSDMTGDFDYNIDPPSSVLEPGGSSRHHLTFKSMANAWFSPARIHALLPAGVTMSVASPQGERSEFHVTPGAEAQIAFHASPTLTGRPRARVAVVAHSDIVIEDVALDVDGSAVRATDSIETYRPDLDPTTAFYDGGAAYRYFRVYRPSAEGTIHPVVHAGAATVTVDCEATFSTARCVVEDMPGLPGVFRVEVRDEDIAWGGGTGTARLERVRLDGVELQDGGLTFPVKQSMSGGTKRSFKAGFYREGGLAFGRGASLQMTVRDTDSITFARTKETGVVTIDADETFASTLKFDAKKKLAVRPRFDTKDGSGSIGLSLSATAKNRTAEKYDLTGATEDKVRLTVGEALALKVAEHDMILGVIARGLDVRDRLLVEHYAGSTSGVGTAAQAGVGYGWDVMPKAGAAADSRTTLGMSGNVDAAFATIVEQSENALMNEDPQRYERSVVYETERQLTGKGGIQVKLPASGVGTQTLSASLSATALHSRARLELYVAPTVYPVAWQDHLLEPQWGRVSWEPSRLKIRVADDVLDEAIVIEVKGARDIATLAAECDAVKSMTNGVQGSGTRFRLALDPWWLAGETEELLELIRKHDIGTTVTVEESHKVKSAFGDTMAIPLEEIGLPGTDLLVGAGIELQVEQSTVTKETIVDDGYPLLVRSQLLPESSDADFDHLVVSGFREIMRKNLDKLGIAARGARLAHPWQISVSDPAAPLSMQGVAEEAGATLAAPAAAISSDATVTAVTSLPATDGTGDIFGLRPASALYRFDSATASLTAEATLTIAMPAAGPEVPHAGLRIHRFEPLQQRWVALPTTARVGSAEAAIDRFGTYVVGYDDSPPAISLLRPDANGAVASARVRVEAACEDGGSGIAADSAAVEVDGVAAQASWDATTSLLSAVTPALADGEHALRVRVADSSGNATASADVTFTVDTIAPASPAPPSASAAGGSIGLTWNASMTSDVHAYRVYRRLKGDLIGEPRFETTATHVVDSCAKPGAEYEYALAAVDRAGNESAPSAWSAGCVARLDTIVPMAPQFQRIQPALGSLTLQWYSPSPDWEWFRLVRGSVAYPANRDDGVVVYEGSELSFADTGLVNHQTYYYALYVRDAAGNWSAARTWSGHPYDTTPPKSTVDLDPAVPDGMNGWYRTEPTVTLTVDKPTLNRWVWWAFSGAEWQYSGPFRALQGENWLSWYSDDSDGNVEIEDPGVLIKVDSIPPVVDALRTPSHADPASWYPEADVRMLWSAEDTASGVVGYSWSLAPSPGTAPDEEVEDTRALTTLHVPHDGRWTFAVRAIDVAGNAGETVERDVLVDAAPPRASIRVMPARTATRTVTVEASAEDSTAVRMRVDSGGGFGDWSDVIASTPATLGAEDGTKTVRAEFRDEGGGVTECSATVLMDVPAAVSRVAGADRYRTSIAASRSAFTTASTVVLVSGATFPDGLAAAALAGAYRAPVLATPPHVLHPDIVPELVRLAASHVIVVGSSAAVDDVVAAAAGAGGRFVERIGGADRYATSALVARRVAQVRGGSFGRRAFVARGDMFPDALAVAPLAARSCTPVLLVRTAVAPASIASAVADLDLTRLTVVGSPSAVASSTADSLAVAWDRVFGVDRWETATQVARLGISEGGGAGLVGVATGRDFPDALAAGPVLGRLGGSLVLTDKGGLPDVARRYLEENRVGLQRVEVFGGVPAVSQAAYDAVEEAAR